MRNYYFQCDINLDHPSFSELRGDNGNLKAMSFTSRSFMTPEACFHALQEDASKRLDILVKRKESITRIDELNPMHTTGTEELEEQMQADECVRSYVSTWDHDIISRVTITSDDIDDDCDPIEIHEMDISYILKYELCDYDDNMEIQLDGRAILLENSSSVLQ